MKCSQVERWLTLGAKELVPPGVREEVEAHLRGCASCRETRQCLVAWQEVAAQMDPVTVPPGLAERAFRGAMNAEPEPGFWDALFPMVLRSALVGCGVAAALAIGAWSVAPPVKPSRQSDLSSLIVGDHELLNQDGVTSAILGVAHGGTS